VLIDSGEDCTAKKYVSFLFDTVFPATGTTSIAAILLSHGHGDHQGGVLDILDQCKKRGLPTPEVFKHNVKGGGHFPSRGFKTINIENGEIIPVQEGLEIEVLACFAVSMDFQISVGLLIT
jgi:glyoxylase-like metal-dependent hydrolase (beta-lactamase superfamily II)